MYHVQVPRQAGPSPPVSAGPSWPRPPDTSCRTASYLHLHLLQPQQNIVDRPFGKYFFFKAATLRKLKPDFTCKMHVGVQESSQRDWLVFLHACLSSWETWLYLWLPRHEVCVTGFSRVLRNSRIMRKLLGLMRVENKTCLPLRVREGGPPENHTRKCPVLSSRLSRHALILLGNISGLLYNLTPQPMSWRWGLCLPVFLTSIAEEAVLWPRFSSDHDTILNRRCCKRRDSSSIEKRLQQIQSFTALSPSFSCKTWN